MRIDSGGVVSRGCVPICELRISSESRLMRLQRVTRYSIELKARRFIGYTLIVGRTQMRFPNVQFAEAYARPRVYGAIVYHLCWMHFAKTTVQLGAS
jgi:hypothetical protein